MGAIIIVACIFSVLSFCLSAYCLIEIKSMQRSTHRFVMYDPKRQKTEELGDVENFDEKKMDEIYDNIF